MLLDLRLLFLTDVTQQLVLEPIESDAEVDDRGFIEDLSQEFRVAESSGHIEIELLIDRNFLITKNSHLQAFYNLYLLLENAVNRTLKGLLNVFNENRIATVN